MKDIITYKIAWSFTKELIEMKIVTLNYMPQCYIE